MSKRTPLSFNVERVAPSGGADATGLPANSQTRKQAKNETKTVRARGTFIAAHVAPEAAKQFKLLAVQRDATTQDLVVEAINDLFAKYGLSRIA